MMQLFITKLLRDCAKFLWTAISKLSFQFSILCTTTTNSNSSFCPILLQSMQQIFFCIFLIDAQLNSKLSPQPSPFTYYHFARRSLQCISPDCLRLSCVGVDFRLPWPASGQKYTQTLTQKLQGSLTSTSRQILLSWLSGWQGKWADVSCPPSPLHVSVGNPVETCGDLGTAAVTPCRPPSQT